MSTASAAAVTATAAAPEASVSSCEAQWKTFRKTKNIADVPSFQKYNTADDKHCHEENIKTLKGLNKGGALHTVLRHVQSYYARRLDFKVAASRKVKDAVERLLEFVRNSEDIIALEERKKRALPKKRPRIQSATAVPVEASVSAQSVEATAAKGDGARPVVRSSPIPGSALEAAQTRKANAEAAASLMASFSSTLKEAQARGDPTEIERLQAGLAQAISLAHGVLRELDQA